MQVNDYLKESPFHLMLSFMVNLHGGEGTRGEATARNVAVERRLAAVGVQVFTQVDQILTATKISAGVLRKHKCNCVFNSFILICTAAASEDVIPVFAVVTAVWLFVTVAELDMVAQ